MESATLWDVPAPLDTHDVPVDPDTVITLRRHGNPDGPRLVLSHGNGLAIDLYYPFWSLLAEDFRLDYLRPQKSRLECRQQHRRPQPADAGA